jgi:subtilisin family serine protease
LGILRSEKSADVIVEFEASQISVEARGRAAAKGLRSLGPEELSYKRIEYASLKEEGLAGLQGVTVLQDYDNLPTSFVRVSNEDALNTLLSRPEVRAVYENRALRHVLTQSLPLIEQPAAAAVGLDGTGTTVAVLDSGVDYTIAPFNCTSPGVPAGCRVVATRESAPNDFTLDSSGHGTNVSAIVATTAGDADLVVADVFDGTTAFFNHIIDAINWTITNQATFNIVALNLSLGNDEIWGGHCTTHTLATPLNNAKSAGIQPIISSGNTAVFNGTFADGVAAPACVPAAVSVGAVYDANVGQQSWAPIANDPRFDCTDSTTAADQLTCFSQTAPFLSLYAPGALITAGGSTLGGTSQAAPHVAGAWAIMREAMPSATEAAILTALQTEGDPIIDTRPSGSRTTSRINLPEPSQLLMLGSGVLALWGLSTLRVRGRSLGA